MHRTLVCLLLLATGPALSGCGSKISEANFYRVQYGMTEEDVEELLGPPHRQTVTPSPDGDSMGEEKSQWWTRGPLVIQVRFVGGKVAGRSSEGIAGESLPPPVTRPVASR
jgi:hypothetical protein